MSFLHTLVHYIFFLYSFFFTLYFLLHVSSNSPLHIYKTFSSPFTFVSLFYFLHFLLFASSVSILHRSSSLSFPFPFNSLCLLLSLLFTSSTSCNNIFLHYFSLAFFLASTHTPLALLSLLRSFSPSILHTR